MHSPEEREPHVTLRAPQLAVLLERRDAGGLASALAALSPEEAAHAVSRLDDAGQQALWQLLPPEQAAALVQLLPQSLVAEHFDELDPQAAAAIVDRLPSDEQTDLLAELDAAQAQAVLARMAPGEAADVNRLSGYAADTAGGLMATEYLAYPSTTTVAELLADLRRRAEEYAQYPVQYVYVVDGGELIGVVPLRDLLFQPDDQPLSAVMQPDPRTVAVDAPLDELRGFFERWQFQAAPVVDAQRRLLGVVVRWDVDEAAADRAQQVFLRFSGIVMGEEFRTMPLWSRVGGRLAWLAATMLLSFVAASVVGLFQATLAEVIALAVFLPVISGMSGNAGNQAIAVTMRELAVGLVQPHEIRWVLAKEAGVGAINGLALGVALTLVALVWKGDPLLGLVVGCAQALAVLVAACLGGVIPLVLKRLRLDPALASAPILTTITDATGFFLTLGLASVWLAARL